MKARKSSDQLKSFRLYEFISRFHRPMTVAEAGGHDSARMVMNRAEAYGFVERAGEKPTERGRMAVRWKLTKRGRQEIRAWLGEAIVIVDQVQTRVADWRRPRKSPSSGGATAP